MYAAEEASLLVAQAGTPAQLAAMVARRVSGEPLEQIIGWAEFRGLQIHVEPGVFVPRRRTELLVDAAIRMVRDAWAADGGLGRPGRQGLSLHVVDLCCGSGAVGAAIAAEVEGVELFAVDIDPTAARCARRNLDDRATVLVGDLFDPLPQGLRGRVDVVVANAPYVPSDAVALMPPEARDHEPRAALDGGTDGLHVQRRIIEQATVWLAPAGRLVIETSQAQADGTVAACTDAGLEGRVVSSNRLDATAVVARHSVGFSGV